MNDNGLRPEGSPLPEGPIVVTAEGWRKRHNELWDMLVPRMGPAATVQGEVIRISGRVSYEVHDNGGMNWDDEYVKALEALQRYLTTGIAVDSVQTGSLAEAIAEIEASDAYNCFEEADLVCECAVAWVIKNPAPIRLGKVDYGR